MPRFPANKTNGFTLIEILIALAILSISLTAIIKATSQNIKDTLYLQDKTIANWVAMNVMNEARLGFLKLPVEPGELNQDTKMLGEEWTSHAYYLSSRNPHIREIHVKVSKKSATKPLITLTGYVYAA
ncbi:MAG: type II secretion system minor pseudopilin GspI [Pseudomonadota bacterium]